MNQLQIRYRERRKRQEKINSLESALLELYFIEFIERTKYHISNRESLIRVGIRLGDSYTLDLGCLD